MDLSSAINVIESVAGFTDADTAVGEAWAVVTTQLQAAPVPVPVPVSERLPGPEDCDGEGRCWWLLLEHECDAMWCESPTVTHWLPTTALPVPQGGGGVMADQVIGYVVMRAIAWDVIEAHGVPVQSPPDGPQRFIQVFDTEEQAVAFSINEVGMTTPNRPPQRGGGVMANQHPITPPPDLLKQWLDLPLSVEEQLEVAARWGADQELEACCGWLEHGPFGFSVAANAVPEKLRAARRPKPPSLKEQALETLGRISKDGYPCNHQDDKDWETIRRALEQLDD